MKNQPEALSSETKLPERELAVDIPPFRWTAYQWDSLKRGFLPRFLHKDAVFYLQNESCFLDDPDQKVLGKLTIQQGRAIYEKTLECPECNGTGERWVPMLGQVTGIRVMSPKACLCIGFKRFFSRWLNIRNVAEANRGVHLAGLERFSANFSRWRDRGLLPVLCETVRRYPDNCYLLAGAHGLGKSTLMTALYGHALGKWVNECHRLATYTEAVFIVHATVLAAELHAWEMKDVGKTAEEGEPCPLPTITYSRIMAAVKAGLKPCIFIEEIDKFKMDSEFQRRQFSLILDATHAAGGQIVATSNLQESHLRGKLGPQYGGGFVRRIIGPRGNTGVDIVQQVDGTAVQELPDSSQGGYYINFTDCTIKKNLRPEGNADPNASTPWVEGPTEEQRIDPLAGGTPMRAASAPAKVTSMASISPPKVEKPHKETVKSDESNRPPKFRPPTIDRPMIGVKVAPRKIWVAE